MTNLDYALKYLARGWSLIPIAPRSKLPAIKSWTEFQTTLPTEQEVRLWFTQNSDTGIALVCGKVSGVIVVDIDSGKGEVDKEGLELPPTLSQRTGSGGSHLIYKWREGLTGPKVGIRKGIDIRSDNSYIILAPSIHPNGTAYEWIDEDEDITEAPKWLDLDKQEKEKVDWDKFLTDKKFWGVQNMSATQVAGKIMYEMSPEMWEPLGFPAFQMWNKNVNVPPLPEKELLTIWNSIKKTHLRNNQPPVTATEEAEPVSDDEEAVRKLFKKNKRQGTFLLAKYIVKKYEIITVGESEREMFVYQDGIYFRAENEIIFPEIQRVLGEEVDRASKSETFSKICDMTHKPRSTFEETSPEFIPLKNGVYNFVTNELFPHSPDYKFKYKFPITFNPTALCPKTDKFLTDILNPSQREIVLEWIGYYFYRIYMFKKAIIFVGAGDTGKTTLLEVITYLLGRENISAISLQKMSGDKFSAAHLYEKHGNLVDELSAKDITDTGSFKVATGGGTVTGEYKFGNQFAFHNFSKFTFACNRIPDVQDTNDEAYFNRWMVVRFENTIKKAIPNFVDSLKTEEERSGLFNVAMVGLRRLLENKRFSYLNNADDTKAEMMRSGSSIAMFAQGMLEKEWGMEISREDMYNAYVDYCQKNKLAPQTKEMLGRRLTDYTNYISDGTMEVPQAIGKPKKVRVWRNAKLRVTEEAKVETKKVDKEFSEW